MNREQMARDCAWIEKAGESVLEYLRLCGCVSPWGTWFRLQKEELGRAEHQITDGKGGENMQKITLEQKKKAVEIALSGESPLQWLKKCGSKNPSATWYMIKKNLEKADPETYARLNAKIEAIFAKHGLGIHETDGAPAAADPERTDEPEKTEEPEKEDKDVAEITKPVNYGGFDIMAVKSTATGFRYESDLRYGMMIWRTISGDEVNMTAEEWHKLAAELPEVMRIFGI